jgi:hypothetical protein
MAKRGRGRGRTVRGGGSDCAACTQPNGQTGGKMSGLNPVSLSGDSFDKSGGSLAKQAHNLYVKQNHDLASLKGQNAMMGGRSKKRAHRRGKGKSAKKYSRKSRSRSRSKSRSKSRSRSHSRSRSRSRSKY